MAYLIKLGPFYVIKDGELETSYNPMHQTQQYKSGIKTTRVKKEATRFELNEASKYHRVLGYKGKRGQIIKDRGEKDG